MFNEIKKSDRVHPLDLEHYRLEEIYMNVDQLVIPVSPCGTSIKLNATHWLNH